MRRFVLATAVLAAALAPWVAARAQAAADTTLLAAVAAGPQGIASNAYLRQLREARRLQDAGSHAEAATILRTFARAARRFGLSG